MVAALPAGRPRRICRPVARTGAGRTAAPHARRLAVQGSISQICRLLGTALAITETGAVSKIGNSIGVKTANYTEKDGVWR